MKYEIRVPGSCGELVQGIDNDINYLVTCPINVYSYAVLEPEKAANPDEQDAKVRTLIKNLTEKYGVDFPGRLEIRSDLPHGKGMSSSSADLAAAYFAFSLGTGIETSLTDMFCELLRIEPTDGIFFDGIYELDHVYGRRINRLGNISGLQTGIFDFGGSIDTIAFNKRKDLRELNRGNEKPARQAFNMIAEGIRSGNPALIGAGASRSSLLNQIILEKRDLEIFIDFAHSAGAYGVNTAHSGTVCGVIHNDERIIGKIREKFPRLDYLGNYSIIGTGAEAVVTEE